MGVPCPYCKRITAAKEVGHYTCIGCGKLFQIAMPTWYKQAAQYRIQLLRSLVAELEQDDSEMIIEVALVQAELDGWLKETR